MAQDRVIKGASDGRLYRVLAGEAHSWTFLLIEDQLGERFRIDTRSGAVSPISDPDVQRLMDTRAFRPWSGSRVWASLNDLPLARTSPIRSDSGDPVIDQNQSPNILADA